MSKQYLHLSRKLSRRIILLAVPLFVLTMGVFYKNANMLLHKEALMRSTTTLNSTLQLVENYLTTIETAARSNVWLLEENFNPDSLPLISRRIVSLNKSVLSCSVSTEPDVFPQYGKYFSVYSVNEGDTIITVLEPEFEYFEKNWYKKPLQSGRPCWINPFSDFNEGTINHHDAVGSYCIPLRPGGGRIMGVVSADFSFKNLQQTIFATHHPYPSSYYMLLGPVGGYLIHPESSLLFKKTIFSATDSIEHPDIIALGREMTAGNRGTMHVVMDNELCHVCYAPVPGTGWSLALVCHDDDVLADYNHLTLVMLVIIAIGLVLIWWITLRVVKHNIGPLKQLMEATKKIAERDYENVLPPSNHKDVLGKLQNAFREMQLAIIAHTNKIKSMDEELKKETAELEQALPLAQEVSKRKQQFVQSVSQHISTPLNIIEGLTSVIYESIQAKHNSNTTQDKLQKENIQNLTHTLKHNAYLLNRMMVMLYDSSDTGLANPSRYEKNDEVSCNMVAMESIEHTEKLFHVKEIHFESELPDNFCIHTNHLFLMRTIRELLYNAARFTDGLHISLYITQTEDCVRFIVEDVGPGLPENAEKLIFTPFTKVNDLAEGLGLGLPFCYGLATSLGGRLIYDENYQQGCRFSLEIPK